MCDDCGQPDEFCKCGTVKSEQQIRREEVGRILMRMNSFEKTNKKQNDRIVGWLWLKSTLQGEETV